VTGRPRGIPVNDLVIKANEERDVGTTDTQTPVGAHLVGGPYAPDAEQALTCWTPQSTDSLRQLANPS
jgi:hypothetical protein